jgi:NADH-quinone oxidoreductase subunit C
VPSVRERIDVEEARAHLEREFGPRISNLRVNFGQLDLTVKPHELVEMVTFLRDASGFRMRYFTFLSGVDRSEFGPADAENRPHPLEVLIHLYSPDHVLHANIHVPVDPVDAKCPSISKVFAGALWHERETHEMFGIDFEGHPGLVNLYLPEDFEGRPLLKSFKLPSRMVKDWPGAKDPEEAAAGGR